MKAPARTLAALSAASLIAVGSLTPAVPTALPSHAAPISDSTVTITPNPYFTSDTFRGWGTSLAWFANATGTYGSEDADNSEYGRELREELYQAVFGANGLNLNIARYNIGGGNASDVAYSYPFMRPGGAVPGYWREAPSEKAGTYGDLTTNYADRDKLAEAWDPTNPNHYDFTRDAGQRWWIERGAQDIDKWEAFANSAPYFMTRSGYVSGGFNAWDDNLAEASIDKFTRYLTHVVDHLESEYGVQFETIEPFNEPYTGFWSTPKTMASQYEGNSDAHGELIRRYAELTTGKNLAVTPYTTATKKPQEGMQVSPGLQNKVVESLAGALSQAQTGAVVAANDETNPSRFVEGYSQYSQVAREAVKQMNVHMYGHGDQTKARDLAQFEDKHLSMSEIEGDWTGKGGFDPFSFANGIGMAREINNDIYRLRSSDFVLWQPVEDLYNMYYDRNANPPGENLNWGTVFIDFDCTIKGEDGALYSKRVVDSNGGTTDGISPCQVLVNQKFNAVRNYTQFIHPGDQIIANNHTADNLAALGADGQTLTIVHTNSGDSARTVKIDLSNFANIDAQATLTPYVTTRTGDDIVAQGPQAATMDNLLTTSNVPGQTVKVDVENKQAVVEVPAQSITTFVIEGVNGISEDAPQIHTDQPVLMQALISDKVLTATGSDNDKTPLQMSPVSADSAVAAEQVWRLHEVERHREGVKAFVIEKGNSGQYLRRAGDIDDWTTYADLTSYASARQAGEDPNAVFIANTRDGVTYTFVNGLRAISSDNRLLYNSDLSDSQEWRILRVTVKGSEPVYLQTPVDVMPTLPDTVIPIYEWGEGQPAEVTWNEDDVAQLEAQVATPGTYVVKGTGVDVWGQEFPVTATVYVGEFTVTDPASLTVTNGLTAQEVQDLAPREVGARVGTSQPVKAAVTWDWDGFEAKFAAAKPGDLIVVPGSVALSETDKTIPATLYIHVTGASVEDIALTSKGATASANYEESGWGVAKAIDGDLQGKGWSTWASQTRTEDAVATVTLPEGRSITSVEVHYFRDGRASWPGSVMVEYLGADEAWHECGRTDLPADSAQAPVFTVDCAPATEPVAASKVRFTNYLREDKTYINVAEFVVWSPNVSDPVPAADDRLADLRVDGVSVDGFDPDITDYRITLPADRVSAELPIVQAFARDTAATVTVTSTDEDGQRVYTFTVTSADGQQSHVYTLTIEIESVPSPEPTPEPSGEPTPEPSGEPTPEPSGEPTPVPSGEPTPVPSGEPTPVPSGEPTPEPSGEPTPEPSGEPTPVPSTDPSQAPQPVPSASGESTVTASPTASKDPSNGTRLPATGAQIALLGICALALAAMGSGLVWARRH